MKLLALLCAVLLVACGQPVQELQQEVQETEQAVQNTIEETIREEVPIPLEPTTIVAFGDSLTAGFGVEPHESYPAVLERNLRAEGYDVTVINEGRNGDTSTGALERIADVLAHDPDIVIIEIGVNDILSGVPAETTTANIDEIVSALKEEDVTVILAGMEAFGEFQGYSFTVQTMYPGLAQKHDVAFIPFFLAGTAGNQALNLPDYVHPNAQGYEVIVEQNVQPVVEAHLNNTKRI